MISMREIRNAHEASKADGQYVYLLVDTAQKYKFMRKWLGQKNRDHFSSLLEETIDDELPLYLSPLLINFDDVINGIEEHNELEILAISNIIISILSIQNLNRHLKPYLEAELPNGSPALFRFFDPHVAVTLPYILFEDDYESMMLPIDEWYCFVNEDQFQKLPKIITEINGVDNG